MDFKTVGHHTVGHRSSLDEHSQPLTCTQASLAQKPNDGITENFLPLFIQQQLYSVPDEKLTKAIWCWLLVCNQKQQGLEVKVTNTAAIWFDSYQDKNIYKDQRWHQDRRLSTLQEKVLSHHVAGMLCCLWSDSLDSRQHQHCIKPFT